ncbi:MAG: hypothetical protein H7144_03285, partial [Burkholderiales bacterium]|nr:hypothetical protein [Phycisphaerae bacterium]
MIRHWDQRAGVVVFSAIAVLCADVLRSNALALPAFPGAEGFGGTALTGGLTGDVYHVTSLADTSTPGTLRYGIRESGFPAGGRTIVFDVGGTIQLTSSLDIKNVSKLYIAGQTAPSPVTLLGNTFSITSSSDKTTSNIVVRYLSARNGVVAERDSATMAGSGSGNNLIFDHLSTSWGRDENLSTTNNNTNVSVQYCMNYESLDDADHGYGSLIRPQIVSSVSYHHNLIANNRSRNPRPGSYNQNKLTFDFRNNVVYNWLEKAGYTGGSSASDGLEYVDMNYVGNYVIAGPESVNSTAYAFTKSPNVHLQAYQSGNRIDADRLLNPGGVPNGIDNGWGMWHNQGGTGSFTQLASPIAFPAMASQSATDAYNGVMNHVGNFWWNRDAIDARIIDNVKTNTGQLITAPDSDEWNNLISAPMTTRGAGYDSDNDGMPDAWEATVGTNPLAANNQGDFDSDGYSDLEEYINEVGAFPASSAITWAGGSGRFALTSNWDISWQPSRFDTVKINSGIATVDVVGQHAGTVSVIGGTLSVTSGWIDIAGQLKVGSANGNGVVDHTGGVVFAESGVRLGDGPSGPGYTGTYSITGGTLVTTDITSGIIGGKFNFDGG